MIKKNNLYSNGDRYAKWVEQPKAKFWSSLKSANQAIKYLNRDEIACYEAAKKQYEIIKKIYVNQLQPTLSHFYQDSIIVELKLTEISTHTPS
jgi:hypothetical protein